MKLQVDFLRLDDVLKYIGVQESDKPLKGVLPPLKPRITEEPEDGLANVVPLPGGGIGYKTPKGDSVQVVLYIKTPYEDEESLSEEPARKTRFHLDFCKTLENMKIKNRFERYVVTNETHGKFKIHPYNLELKKHGDEMEARLGPCKNCLTQLDYQGYANAGWAEKKEIFENFSLEEFFEKYETKFPVLPENSRLSSPENNYPPNWDEISLRVRQKHNWQCSCCEAFFHENKPLLHTHHKDGNKRNNISSNLIPLCAACHPKQPGHERMGISPSNKRAIEKIRQKQGFAKNCPNCP